MYVYKQIFSHTEQNRGYRIERAMSEIMGTNGIGELGVVKQIRVAGAGS